MKLLWLIVFAKCAHLVSGECTNRTYGPECSQKCGFCKNDAPCDGVTGLCQGCSAGYEGILCLSRCSHGFYGEDCLLRCTMCVNNNCDPMNGTCANGTVLTTERTQPVTIITIVTTQTTTTTPQKGLVFDSPAVLFGLSVPEYAQGRHRLSQHTMLQEDDLREGSEQMAGTELITCVLICLFFRNIDAYGAVGNEGFFISISNLSNLFTGQICYRSKLNTIPLASDTYPCIGRGRYLTVFTTQRTTTIEFDICEVAVTGCPFQRYGYDCSQTCACPDECHYETGQCISYLSVCNITGRWGEDCKEICGFCKDGADCDKTTGACPSGCAAGYRSSQCTVECISGTFGEDCGISCGNCVNSRCNPVTGACDSQGCQTGYVGTKCFNTNNFYNNVQGQLVNTWEGNVATGSISYNVAGLFDGNNASCAFQNAPFSNTIGSTAFLFQLTTERVLREITLTFSTQGITASAASNYAGFTVSISDGTNRRDCFTWNSTGVPEYVQTIPCLGLAKSINVTNERRSGVTYPSAWGPNPGLGFCEILATGCPAGRYGTYCEKSCICQVCDYVTGACPSIDQNCQNRTYGVNCLEQCGNCRNNDVCNIETGACPNGCTAGYNGTLCKDACLAGHYGENCLQTCSQFCKNNRVCNSVTGSCPEGCSAGYQGSTCDQTCENGTYGQDCLNNCSRNCQDNACNYVSGNCTKGCKIGYQGDKCLIACENGKYGQDCSYNCSRNCRDNSCHIISGNCTKGCIIGYQGDLCSAECSRGTYGQDCTSQCNNNCINSTCNHIDGACTLKKPDNGTIIVEPVVSGLSTDDLAMLICLVLGVITLIVAVIFIIIAAKAHKRFKQEAEECEEEGETHSISKSSHDALPATPNNRQTRAEDHLVHVQGPFRSLPKPAPPLSDDSGLYFGVDDVPSKTEDYYNASVFACGIPIPALRDLIKNDQRRIEEEYKELQKGVIHPCNIANKPENKPKNRYLTVLPYDHSIVELAPLSGKPDTKYINANYIDSTLEDKAYIATQGPMTSTIGDFWRLVWQTYCGKIVMLTKLKEKNKIKCAQYWPNKGSTLEFGLYKIAVQAEKKHVTYVQRALRLEDMTTSECRTIHHFHYMAWPDHGTPDHVQLVAFHRHVTSVTTDFIGPMVVHCSAGIGRTGTFIALDSLLKQAKLTNQVQVFNFIRLMRKDRMNMIQTGDQYLYVYHTIYEALNHKNTTIKRKDFPKEYFKLEDPSDKSEKRTVGEFKILQEMRGVFTADNLNPKPKRKGIKAAKARDSASIGKLQTIKIPAYGESRGFQLVQSLMPTMDVDLWNFVMTSEAAVVVSVDKQSSDVLGSFLPTVGETRVTSYMATSISSSAINENVNASCSVVEITNRNTEQSDEITVIRCCIDGKKSKMTASEMANLAVLIEHTEKASSLTGETIVLSSDGISGPGLLCAVSYAIQDAIIEKSVDIFQTVRQFHIRNPKFIPNQEDYDFCYQSVNEFLLTDNDYANIEKDQE
ncbi:uncharacterized protein LOC133177046 [Saccostrea echinata]|uniref:uncharacterized protein LOC133177046 n=1 Tax=Saccostrea echinata TaxID=191078 RepID=UPI002A7EF04F|nr:uncharacterized protein LOC133177046 [Saccostrea echinata]